jgi:hypothetical protein
MLTAREIKNRVLERHGIKRPTSIYDGPDPAEFINREMVIPETGQPLILDHEQASVLRAMTERDANGDYLYSTLLYSAPKKSGKTTVGAGIALWQALRVPDGQVYIIGNDQRQADNRMTEAIRYALMHNPRFVGRYRTVRNTIYLDNGTKIESIPVDPRGEAGMNPTGLFWTEAWGAIGTRPELLWTEAALSPTRTGQSFKFVESYAGYSGQSLILERLYQSIVKDGRPHPAAPELYTNQRSIAYWCTRRYMPWQVENPEYYEQEAREKTPSEFARIHDNQWSASSEAFIPVEWWDACKPEHDLAPVPTRQSIVLGVDAAVDSDYFAIVGVSVVGGKFRVRYCRVWKPEKGGRIDLSEPAAAILELSKTHNIECIAYDPMHMEYMAQTLGDNLYWYKFNQGGPRLIADKYLYDAIREKQIEHDGSYPELREAIVNADKKPEDSKLRIIKRNANGHIDPLIALSMAVERASVYNL